MLYQPVVTCEQAASEFLFSVLNHVFCVQKSIKAIRINTALISLAFIIERVTSKLQALLKKKLLPSLVR